MSSTATETTASPFHAGEQAVQTRLGVREIIEPWARRVVRPFLTPEHRSFYASLPYLVIAARDAEGRPWPTLLAGAPGFARSPDARTLRLDTQLVVGDALAGGLGAGADVGILGIELATRRRNRVNGRVVSTDAGGISLAVEQSFGNCPQYIHARGWRAVELRSPAPAPVRSARLSSGQQRRIRAADTLFIATGHRGEGEDPAFGMDASHRGGRPGFVRVEDDQTLLIPDYSGNNHFNTIGNLELDPRAGLLFVDFETGGMLQLSGRTEIDWDSDEVRSFPGARRLIRFCVEAVVELAEALPLRWGADADSVRELRVVGKKRESAEVCSFVFAARDGGPLVKFEAGQHLPLELSVEGRGLVTRTYSLSNGPSDGLYRISVKREAHGLVSGLLHEQVEVGAILGAKAPAGDFVLDHGARRVVLISAGVGITPMLSMLHELVARDQGREVVFVHGARDGQHHAFAEELGLLADARAELRTHVAYSRPRPEDKLGRDYDHAGRLDGASIVALLEDLDVEVYMCGPLPFMAAIQTQLEGLGLDSDHIHTESFGPSAG